MLGSADEAEDLVQETYLRAWRAYGTFEGGGSHHALGVAILTATTSGIGAISVFGGPGLMAKFVLPPIHPASQPATGR